MKQTQAHFPNKEETLAFLDCTDLRALDKYKPQRNPDFTTASLLGSALVGQRPLTLRDLSAFEPEKVQEEEGKAAARWMADIRNQPFFLWLQTQEAYREITRFFANRRKAKNCPAALKTPYADVHILHSIAFGYLAYLHGKEGKPLRGSYSTATAKKAVEYVDKLLALPGSSGLFDYQERKNLENLLVNLRIKTVKRKPKLDETLAGREFVHWTGLLFLSTFGQTFSGAIAHAAIMVAYEPDKRTLDGQLKELRDAYKKPKPTP